MTGDDVLARARSAVGHKTVYKLGAGGMHPDDPTPANLSGECDCSGFVMWALHEPRQQPDGVWEGTDEISADAIHATALSDSHDLFSTAPWKDARPGMALVWHGVGGHHGHIGVVGSVGPTGPETVVHCSAGNFRRFGDAIQETDSGMFERMGAIVAVWKGLEA